MTVAAKKKTTKQATKPATIPPTTARSEEAPESGERKRPIVTRAEAIRAAKRISRALAAGYISCDGIYIKPGDPDYRSLDAYRDLAIGIVGQLVGELRSAGRDEAEWEALMQHLLDAMASTPRKAVV